MLPILVHEYRIIIALLLYKLIMIAHLSYFTI